METHVGNQRLKGMKQKKTATRTTAGCHNIKYTQHIHCCQEQDKRGRRDGDDEEQIKADISFRILDKCSVYTYKYLHQDYRDEWKLLLE